MAGRWFRNKIFITCFLGVLMLGATALTEYLFYRQEKNIWVKHFSERLHKQEKLADEMLASFRDSVDINSRKWDEDIVYVGFREGKIFFWTNEQVGIDGLYELLKRGDHFLRIGNAYYESRYHRYKDVDYFALLHIKDNNPYANKYIKDRFGKFLEINDDNIGYVSVLPEWQEGSLQISDKDGKALFHIAYHENYKEKGSNYVLLSFYILFFLSLFYVYDLVLKTTKKWWVQFLYATGFVLMLIGIRYFMDTNKLPPTPYRLPIFDTDISKDIFVSSIGDLLLSSFCIFQVLYITFVNLELDSQSEKFKRYRYLFSSVIIVLVFCYINFFNFAIDMVVENMDIHLNIAQLVHVGLSSIVAFVSIILAGLVIVIIIYSAVAVFERMLSFWAMFKMVTVLCLSLWLVSHVFHLYTNFWDCFFIWIISLLIAINKYLIKRDIQRSIYILVLFLLSIYIVMVTKKYERDKELRLRLGTTTELIEERDYNFEERLKDIDSRITSSDELRELIENKDQMAAEALLREQLLDLTGYNYYTYIALMFSHDSLSAFGRNELWDSGEYFENMIHRYGQPLSGLNVYSIAEFDGLITYIARFSYNNAVLYIRLDAEGENEGDGYPQILSRKSLENKNTVYHYSYAKYKNGELVSSSGDFIYYRKLVDFGHSGKGIDVLVKDKYSHMLIPVGDNNTLVMSLRESTFALYYMNVLYAFFTCIILSSYGLFFNVNRNVKFRRGTLKARIKNNVISLIFVLFVILTAMSIYINTKSFENRHQAKAMQLLRYINKELERLDCVDWRDCPDIMTVLSDMSEILRVDVNIYTPPGGLVATSRPEIFENGFEGVLVNPKAREELYVKGTTSYIENERIGELNYMSVYVPLVLDNGSSYILNVPYFAQNDELNQDIIITVIITVNIAIVMMVLAFILSGLMAERVTKPLQMINDKLKKMRFGGKNEKIGYIRQDEVGALVQEYNNMVDKLDESISRLARSERESAWREMARQIAHDIKNPLTPMKLNIQFMQRSLMLESPEKFKERFKDVSVVLIEQIDNMASIALAFSDFAKMSVTQNETFDISELARNCAILFGNNKAKVECDIESGIMITADKEQMRRVLINLLKNAEQSIPDGWQGNILVRLERLPDGVLIQITDNGCGIPEEIRKKIFEPNFTTKSSGTGLGLAICQKIIENIGGTISFVTEIEKGTTFTIKLYL